MNYRVPRLDDDGKISESVLPDRLSEVELSATYVTFLDEAGNPLVGKHVLVTVNTTTNEIEDITVEVL